MKLVKLLLLLPIALLMLTPAHATTPTLLTGTIKTTLVRTETRTADGNTFAKATFTDVFAGGIEGNLVGTLAFNILSTGQFTARTADSNFTGMVNGNGPGTASIHATEQGTLSNGVIAQGQFVIGNGTGGLAGIHGEATFQISPGSFTYSVLVHFDPA